MQVWAVTYDASAFTDQIFQNGLFLLDPDSQARIKKFYRREDACRCLIGRLLPRMLLKERGVTRSAMTFASTKAGKPYITTPNLNLPIAFNVSHDNALIAMAFGPGDQEPPAFQVGIDVMKVEIPPREPFPQFVRIFNEQLTALETRTVLSVPQDEGIRLFFWIWTMKEAYTKALGLGLGFDFRRIEYNPQTDNLTVDGKIPKGWEMIKFEIDHQRDAYCGVAAKFVGGDETRVLPRSSQSADWLVHYDAASFVSQAIKVLE